MFERVTWRTHRKTRYEHEPAKALNPLRPFLVHGIERALLSFVNHVMNHENEIGKKTEQNPHPWFGFCPIGRKICSDADYSLFNQMT